MTWRIRCFWVSTCGILLRGVAVAAAVAQVPASGPPAIGLSERIEVEIVNVDVWVTDARGNPVVGLDADSFEVLHDKRPVTISHFSEIRAGAGAEVAPAAAPASHVVLYFDRSRLHPSRYPALIRSLEQFLDTGAVDSERVLVLRQDRGLSVEAPFSSSRAELAQALNRLAVGAPSGLDLEAETRIALDAIREGWEQSQDLVGSSASGLATLPTPGGLPGAGSPGGAGPRAVVGGVGSGAGPDACGMFVNQVQPILEAWIRSSSQRIATTLAHLSSTAGFLAGLPGVKVLLYLSDGLETRPGADLATYASGFCPPAGADLMTGTRSADMTSGFLELTRHANANRVTMYSLQTSGLRALEGSDASGARAAGGGEPRARGAFEASRRAGEREGLGLIAEETGGRAVFGQGDLAPELTRIGDEIRHYYSLAYEPPAGGDRREHRIEVRVGDGSLTTRYRRGYLEKDPSRWLDERIEGALHLGLTSNRLAVRLGAGSVRESTPGSYRVRLHVMVPVEHLAFLPHEDSFRAEIMVRVLARQVDGDALAVEDRSFRVTGSPQATGFADLAVELELAGGVYLAAVGVQDTNSREASFVSTTLQIGPGP